MIPFLDLKKVNSQYAEELYEAAKRVIDSGIYLLGDETKAFEKSFSDYINTTYALACGNGLDALKIIMRAYCETGRLRKGDEVLVPANTYIATILAITENELIPVFVEPDPADYTVGLSEIKAKLTHRTKALLNVHLYGKCSFSSELESLIKENQLIHIEDNAQAVGCFDPYKQKKTGALGDAAGHSFYPGKNLGALGDAGMITTNDEELFECMQALRNYGSTLKYNNSYEGYNSRIDEIQAAMLRVKLKYLDSENQQRIETAGRYTKEIINAAIKLPHYYSDRSHIYHLFVVRIKGSRDKFQEYMNSRNIQTLIHYPIPPHKQVCYRNYNNLYLPVTEEISNEIISLPISSVMNRSEIDYVIDTVNRFRE